MHHGQADCSGKIFVDKFRDAHIKFIIPVAVHNNTVFFIPDTEKKIVIIRPSPVNHPVFFREKMIWVMVSQGHDFGTCMCVYLFRAESFGELFIPV